MSDIYSSDFSYKKMAKFKGQRGTNYNQNDGVAGVVYILGNHGLREDYYKIGCSRHSGSRRAQDLNYDANTGTPGTFECIFEYRTKDCGNAEKDVFRILSNYRRGKKGQEFFQLNKLEFEKAKKTIVGVCGKVDSIIYEVERSATLRAAENSRVNSNPIIFSSKPEPSPILEIRPQKQIFIPSTNQVQYKKPRTTSTLFKIGISVCLFVFLKGIFSGGTVQHIDQPSTNLATNAYTGQELQKSNQSLEAASKEPSKNDISKNLIDANAPPDKPRHQFDKFGKETDYGLRDATEEEIQEPADNNSKSVKANSEDESTQVANAEKSVNLKICLDGRYPTMCKHDLLNEAETTQVANAEKSANLKICLDGRYTTLCNHGLLNETETTQVANAENSAVVKSK